MEGVGFPLASNFVQCGGNVNGREDGTSIERREGGER